MSMKSTSSAGLFVALLHGRILYFFIAAFILFYFACSAGYNSENLYKFSLHCFSTSCHIYLAAAKLLVDSVIRQRLGSRPRLLCISPTWQLSKLWCKVATTRRGTTCQTRNNKEASVWLKSSLIGRKISKQTQPCTFIKYPCKTTVMLCTSEFAFYREPVYTNGSSFLVCVLNYAAWLSYLVLS